MGVIGNPIGKFRIKLPKMSKILIFGKNGWIGGKLIALLQGECAPLCLNPNRNNINHIKHQAPIPTKMQMETFGGYAETIGDYWIIWGLWGLWGLVEATWRLWSLLETTGRLHRLLEITEPIKQNLSKPYRTLLHPTETIRDYHRLLYSTHTYTHTPLTTLHSSITPSINPSITP